MYKHFVGVKNSNEFKAKFRELAKKYHPDKGGNQAIFIEMNKEYQRIIDLNLPFPISNDESTRTANYADEFVDNLKKYAYAQSAAARDQANIWEEIKKARPLTEEETWNQAKESDENLRIIDDLIDIAFTENKTNNWFLFEAFKLDGLTLKHFKYARYKFKKLVGKTVSEDWVSTSYRNYIATRQINWEIQ